MEIVEVLKRGNLSQREIAKRYGRAQSTISELAKEAGISPSHRRKRSPAAKDPKSSFTREQRVSLTDRILGVIGSMVDEGGLNPRELKDATMALKQTLEARRAEDFPEPEPSLEPDESGWVDVGLGDLRVHKKDTELIQRFEELPEKLQRERERMEAGVEGAFPSYGVDPETSPAWMVEAYERMLAKKRGEDVEFEGQGLS